MQTEPTHSVPLPPVNGQLERMTLSAVVTRADGTVEDLGVIADSGDLNEPPAVIFGANPFN